MDDFLSMQSVEQLEALKKQYQDQPSVVSMINGIIEVKLGEARRLQAKADFELEIANMLGELPDPDDVPEVHNIYIHPGMVDVPDGEPEEVEVTNDKGEKTIKMQAPSHQERQWIVELNHATKSGSGSGSGSKGSPRKRGETVFKHNPNGADGNMGNFPSCQRAIDYMGIPNTGKDDARRVLERNGYYTVPYDGVDFTA